MNLPASPQPGDFGQSRGELALDTAARLIEERIVAIRQGSPLRHASEELEAMLRAIRNLSAEHGRAEETVPLAEVPLVRPVPGGPPVLTRVNRAPRAQVPAANPEPSSEPAEPTPESSPQRRRVVLPRRWS